MQKSKSLSNVGQFVSRKIWGNRSKYQNRPDGSSDVAAYTQKWAPSVSYVVFINNKLLTTINHTQ